MLGGGAPPLGSPRGNPRDTSQPSDVAAGNVQTVVGIPGTRGQTDTNLLELSESGKSNFKVVGSCETRRCTNFIGAGPGPLNLAKQSCLIEGKKIVYGNQLTPFHEGPFGTLPTSENSEDGANFTNTENTENRDAELRAQPCFVEENNRCLPTLLEMPQPLDISMAGDVGAQRTKGISQRPTCSIGSSTSVTASRREVRQFMLSMSDALSDSAVLNCNKRFWLQNLEMEAQNMWNLGKELGAGFLGPEREMVERIIELEKRDQIEWTESRKIERRGIEKVIHEDP